MRQSIKAKFAGLLLVPMLALGLTALAPVTTSVSADCENGITAQDGSNCAKPSNVPTDLKDVFSIIANTALFVIGALSVIMLIYGGIRYTISGGDSKAVADAKNTIMYSVIGVVVALLAFAIVNFVINTLIQ